ncbi:NAD-dependent epimerase/dehydratase family protein [Natronococcus wangiae]|uniref:NAD-dependent epimerase/dehydratase family protein n=1 Tax=Natronococcus wangiae TaxID=3068275 RepID=UPI00273FB819|nr:NAD(P)-dependent oxidoreductase [Natronococcus sp. AD5]
MHVFVAGATGDLGRPLVRELVDRDHDVTGLARDERGDRRVERAGGVPHRGDVLATDSLEAGAADADVIVHAATRIPTGPKPTATDWRRNDRVRFEGARNLLEVADAVGVDRLAFPSVVWAYRRRGRGAVAVGDPPAADRTTRSAVETERLLRAAADDGFDVTILRYGLFYGPASTQTHLFGRRLLAGRLPIVGGGPLGRTETLVSAIHATDAARAMAAAIEAGATGTYHVVDERPVTTATFFETFADVLEAGAPRRIPGWLARPIVGRDVVGLLTNDFPTTNDRFTRTVGWNPQYPTVEEGLAAVVDRWLDRGRLRETRTGYEWQDRPESDGKSTARTAVR